VTYEPVIGLEIHAQLRTQTKIFCGCSTAFGAPPNSHVCPVCTGQPGALPVLNRQAVDFAVAAGLALGCRIQTTSIFARKNYFYPDLPKGYQISQYERPLALGGGLEVTVGGTTSWIGLTRIHMEEDAGKSLHEGFLDSDRQAYVDYNRSGVPLIEIVSEPDMRSAAQAAEFFSQLREILVWLGVNDGNMEEGSLRCDANVSVRPHGQTAFGTKTEVKNVNSFRYLQKAIEYEIERQVDVLVGGGKVVQETRLWDSSTNSTHSMRSKEEAHDYRYFPEPDLPPLAIGAEWIEEARAGLPELPAEKRRRFVAEFGIPDYDAGVLTLSRELADYYEAVARESGNAKAASNWVMTELLRKLKEDERSLLDSPVKAAQLARLVRLIDAGTISGKIAKDVFEKMWASTESPEAIVEREGLTQVSDASAIQATVADVIAASPDQVASYRKGKTATLGWFVGQVMKKTRGKANPQLVNELLKKALEP
jgi:aspartyl-tRNA(Asn)/glutamyl-tRNA(Gln) amidotransferase subunit B